MECNLDGLQYRPDRWAMANVMLTQARAEAKMYRVKYEAEKEAKNRACSFILANGLLDEFKSFIEETADMDAMTICRAALLPNW